MNPINKIAGLILGAVTGVLTAVLQMPYAYYVFANNRRAGGSSWPATLLATATIGSFFALGTGLFAILNSWTMIGWGMRVGWAKGIMGATTLPYAFHTEFQRRLVGENATTLFSQFGRLFVAGIDYLFDTDSKGNMRPSSYERRMEEDRILTNLISDNQRLEREIREQLIQNRAQREAQIPAQNEALENNRILLERIDAPATPEQKDVMLLTDDDIEKYKKAIQNLPKEEHKKEENLADYSDKIKCPMILDTSDNPITVVLPDEGPRTYDYNALKAWIETKNGNREDAREPTSNRHLLKDLEIYKGYSPQISDFVNEVREINKQWELELKNRDSKKSVASKDVQLSPKIQDPKEQTASEKLLSLEEKNQAARTARLKLWEKPKQSNVTTTKESSQPKHRSKL